jgi:hypothetical protein
MRQKVSMAAAIVAAIIMLQTLYFKFSAAPESVYIFTVLGLEPYGRIGIGVLELVASILLLWPSSRVFGALLGIGLMGGALMSHLTKLGIEVQGDGGYLFNLCVVVLTCSLVCLVLERRKLLELYKRLFPAKKQEGV